MKTKFNPLTFSYETPDGTSVAAEICEGDSPSDAFRAAAIREQQRKLLPKGEWPKHPSAYVNDEYIGYSTSDLDNYATQVLAAHGITGE